MYKLRRSRPVKTVCFLLGCLFLGLFVLNAAAGVYALSSDRLDFYSDTFADDLREDVFSGLAARKASELRNRSVIYYAVNGDKDDFFSSNRVMKPGGTNFAFSVTDEYGKVLLSNFTPESVLASYTANTRVAGYNDGTSEYTIYDDDDDYVTDFYDPDAWEQTDTTVMENDISADPTAATDTSTTVTNTEVSSSEAQSTTTPAGQPTSEPTAESTTVPTAEPTSAAAAEPTSAASADPTAAAETTARTEGRVNTDPVNRATENVYIQDDTAQGYKSILMYIYPIELGIDDDILNHCIELYHKSYEPKEAQYYRNGAYEVYHQTDFALSINGNVYFIGTEREEYTTATPPRLEPVEVEYYTLTVSVDGALQAKDIAYYANKGLGFVTWYLTHFISLTAVFGLAALFFTVCSLILAGYVKNEEAPVARGIHKFPTDLLFIIFFTLAALFGVILFDDLIDRGGFYDITDRILPTGWRRCARR